MQIYCDGSCFGNPGPGGWAAIFIKNNQVVQKICGYDKDTTNNKMELTAAIKALERVKETDVDIFTDSTYLQQGITVWIKSWKLNNWKNGKIKNVELWEELDKLNSALNVKWHWVKAHNGNKYNEMADRLAKGAIIQKKEFQEIKI
ncbi:ribonuclease HI [Candidatus Bandiella euplotis]|nr:ribonuclease HI [Candidatus Bandiella woodruffii]